MNCPEDESDRNQKTRTAILRAFRDLMFAEGFDGVSMGLIARTAGVARSTLYEHFSSQDELLRASMWQFLNVIADCATATRVPELNKVLNHLWDNRRLTDAVFSGRPRTVISTALVDLIEAKLRAASGSAVPPIPYRLGSIYIAEGQLAMVESWLREQHHSTSEVLSDILYQTGRAAAGVLTPDQPPLN